MKNSEIRKLIDQYKEIIQKQKKKHADNLRLSVKQKEIERRYFHETGRALKTDMKDFR